MASHQQLLEETKAALHSKIHHVLQELERSGVPKPSINDLKASLFTDQVSSSCAEALVCAQAHSRCYPYMDSAKLMELLVESWEAFCNRRDVEIRDITKKITRLQNNPKAKKIDPAGDKLRQMEAQKAKLLWEKTQNQLGLYRIRLLSSLYIQNQAKGVSC
jgi:hypothetical protein